jgi:hypothetical protein
VDVEIIAGKQKNLEGVNAFQELQILHPLGEGDSGVITLSVKKHVKHERI